MQAGGHTPLPRGRPGALFRAFRTVARALLRSCIGNTRTAQSSVQMLRIPAIRNRHVPQTRRKRSRAVVLSVEKRDAMKARARPSPLARCFGYAVPLFCCVLFPALFRRPVPVGRAVALFPVLRCCCRLFCCLAGWRARRVGPLAGVASFRCVVA